ncbi:MAG: hypothetical protein ACKO14_11200 [Armatimonadota bacterium]
MLSFYQVLVEIPAIPDAPLWMWFDAPVVILGTLGFVYRYLRARLLGARVAHTRTPLATSPEVTWFITTRDLPGPLLHTLATGIASTRYPKLQIVILDCGHSHPAKQIVDRLGDPRISIVTSQRTQPEWYQWICSQPGTEFFVVTHDDLHFVADGWLEDIVQPMILDQKIGCVCGEEFPVRLNTIEPGGERVDITFGLSTWMWAARRTAVANQTCDFSFSKRERGSTGNLEVWDQGGLWLESLKRDGWRIAIESQRAAIKWQHFENFDWTRDAGDRKYARLKHQQRSIITVLAQLQLIAYKLRNRA